MLNDTLQLRLLYLRESGACVVRCLEHDIVAQGGTLMSALNAFRAVLQGQMQHTKTPVSSIAPAPRLYHDLYPTVPLLMGSSFHVGDVFVRYQVRGPVETPPDDVA